MKFRENKNKDIIVWLGVVCLLVLSTVIVGGITRLTHSGLSMVDWKPIMGVIPPITDQQWALSFAKYKNFPEYISVFPSMSLAEYKSIFFWEYLHRMIGRLIGIVFFFPWLYFSLKRRYNLWTGTKLFFGFILGGMQGVLGWYMVKSGLVNIPEVSHYRLAAHLVLALIILGYLLWQLLDFLNLAHTEKTQTNNGSWKASFFISMVILLQIVYGAFMSGLHGGFVHNTFPSMSGSFMPSDIWMLTPGWHNLVENVTSVQFIHRSLAWFLVLLVILHFGTARKKVQNRWQQNSLKFLIAVLSFQFFIGVATLLLVVPVPLASLHQFGGALLFMAAIFSAYTFKNTSAA